MPFKKSLLSKTKIFVFFLTGVLFLGNKPSTAQQKHTFALGGNVFLLDGKTFQIISGEMHYTRIPREAWKARMKMAKAMGLNTISTYVFWNVQEPQKGVFNFSGNDDIAAFIKDAQEEGLWVILRPSPYVCAEWEFGGYPYWLQNIKGLVVRSRNKEYMDEYEKYIKELGKQLAPLQITHGGNIILIQVENEYGSYGDDKEYLKMNEDMFRKAGFDDVLFTCDPPQAMTNGYLHGLLPAVNGLDNPEKVKTIIRAHHNGKGPFLISEWYPGWFDWWGAPHHAESAAPYALRLDSVLAAGISINMYMFHGGTTRGFMNGANKSEHTPFQPEISSYDYDAPLDEAGNPTPKFRMFRSVIEKYLPKGEKLPPVPAAKPAMSISNIHFTKSTALINLLHDPVKNADPLTFEKLNQAYGYVWYRTVMEGGKSGLLKLVELRDYAIIMINGQKVGVLDRRLNQDSIQLNLPRGKDTLDILVENLGRINFGPYLLQNNKGITKRVLFDGKEIHRWEMYRLPFNNITDIHFKSHRIIHNGPVLREGTFILDSVEDTYLDMSHWGKGVVWVNGHNLGRYWYVGPQQTIYLPAEWLKKGENKITVLELLKPEQDVLRGIEHPILDSLQQDLQ